ncbi:mevalonate kinase [Battus philenor]|uniref:mevalonate kinase n=1 Tax=Battus philenor TaxID=42288 RepID=UPI0035D0B7A7
MKGKIIKVSAPGKIILHGEHSVLYGKHALAVSLGLRTTAIIQELSKSADPKIHIEFPNVDLCDALNLKPIVDNLFTTTSSGGISWDEPTAIDHDKYLKSIEETLHKIRPGFDDLQNFQKNSLRGFLYAFGGIFGSSGLTIEDFSIKMTSELTVGAGTGSSASFATCLCGAMVKLVKLKSSGRIEEFSEKEKKIISAWAYNCEKITHGSPSGIDNTTSTFGSLVSFKKGEEPLLLPSPEIRVLLIDSRVPRETSRLLAVVAARRGRNTAAIDHVMAAIDEVSITAAELLKKLSATNIEGEIEAIYQHLHELWDMNHCLLATLGVSHPVLEDIRSAAISHGLACKLTGAGGGGNAIVLIPPSTKETTVEVLKSQLLNSGYRVTDTMVGGTGVEIHK